MAKKDRQAPKKEPKLQEPKTVVQTVDLHRMLKDYHGKFRAPRAVRELRKVAAHVMHTEAELVRVNPSLNVHLLSGGIRNVPNKVRVKISRKQGKDAMETEVAWVSQIVTKDQFSGLSTVKED
jgi:large subunit ribosomal protein L31e